MLIFIIKRILAAIPVLIIVTVIAFSLIYMIPGDAAIVAAGENASQERIEQVREQMGLNRPAIVQYFVWMGELLTGNLGTSLISGHTNAEMIATALPVTVSLALLALTWSLIAGVLIGTFAGLNRDSWIDRTLTALTTFGLAVPTFWIGLILVVTFALQLRMFPATGFTPITEGVGPWLSHLVLPALALGTEKAEADLMRRAPRATSEGIFAGGVGGDILYQGIMVSILTLAAYFTGHYIESGVWEITNSADGMTMAFLTMSMAEIFHSFNMRSQRGSVFKLKTQNKYLWAAAALSLLLSTVILYVPFLSRAFGFEHISLLEYAIALGLAFLVIPIVEIVKAIRRAAEKRGR